MPSNDAGLDTGLSSSAQVPLDPNTYVYSKQKGLRLEFGGPPVDPTTRAALVRCLEMLVFTSCVLLILWMKQGLPVPSFEGASRSQEQLSGADDRPR